MKQHYPRILVSLLLCLSAWSAQAHKVNMFAYVEGDDVFVEGYFLDGKKPKNCEITVYDSKDKAVVTGLTNDEGQFTFKIPTPGPLRIKLNAGEGHQTEYTLSAEETSPGGGVAGTETTTSAVAADSENDAASEETNEAMNGIAPSGNAELQLLVRRAVGQSIRPLMRGLDELKERRTMSDIIGGIGIIMGVGGLLLYLQARKLTAKSRSESGSDSE